MLDERTVGMHADIQLAAGGLLHVFDEGDDVCVEFAVGIRGRHVPLGLRERSTGNEQERKECGRSLNPP